MASNCPQSSSSDQNNTKHQSTYNNLNYSLLGSIIGRIRHIHCREAQKLMNRLLEGSYNKSYVFALKNLMRQQDDATLIVSIEFWKLETESA